MPTELSLTPRAQQANAAAQSCAGKEGHSYVGTDHLLLGLLTNDEGAVPKLLSMAGYNHSAFCEEMRKAFRALNTPPPQIQNNAIRAAELLRQAADLLAPSEKTQ